MLFLLLTLAGIVAFPTLRINNSPDLDLPAVAVAGTARRRAIRDRGFGHAPRRGRDLRSRQRQARDLDGVGRCLHDGGGVCPRQGRQRRGQRGARSNSAEFVRISGRSARPGGDPIEAAGGAILTYAVSAPDCGDKAISRFIDDTITRTLLLDPGSRPGDPHRWRRPRNPHRAQAGPDSRARSHRQSDQCAVARSQPRTCQGDAVR